MYRTNDPRFRRRLNEIGQTLESANETAQSSLYIFGQNYIKPCLHSVGNCFSQCYEASCPAFPLTRQERIRRNRRAELNFDFYDDWDEDENDGLLGGWGNDEFDRLTGSYGTITSSQPQRERGMLYGTGKRGRRKSTVLPKGDAADPTVIPGSSGLLGRLFGGKPLRYKPSAAGLQEHPGARRLQTEGEALLEEHEEGGRSRTHRRARSGTVESRDTSDSYSSRGDIFPSDEEDDAIPLDDEFAMVLERRNTQSGPETESASTGTGSTGRRRGKRPSAASRASTRRSTSGKGGRSRASSGSVDETSREDEVVEEPVPSLTELKQEEQRIEYQEEAEVERRRQEAQRLAAERGLAEDAILSSKEATPQNSSPAIAPVSRAHEPSQLPTPLDTEDEEETAPTPEQTKEHLDDTQSPPAAPS